MAKSATTKDAVRAYLASDQGRDAPEAVAVRLQRLPWHVLLAGAVPDNDTVHHVRSLIEREREPGEK